MTAELGKWYWCKFGGNDRAGVFRCAALWEDGIIGVASPGAFVFSGREVLAEVAVCDLPDEARAKAVAERTMWDVIAGFSHIMTATERDRTTGSGSL